MQDAIDAIEDDYTIDVEINTHGGDDDDDDDDDDGNRAVGGVVEKGKRYKVNEYGGEMFVPWTKGYIMPHNLTESLLDQQRAQSLLSSMNAGGGARSHGAMPNAPQTIKNVSIKVEYTAVEQQHRGQAQVEQVLKDVVSILAFS